ncbi:sugar transferase [Spirulina sp. CS-785/01]|uniref:sugar transferase n=1 Tax=Spirulina sp. CS-785/01 TaxID=3021716 RepID=UPI00232CDB87|nr:sugar transferase [Spirulina sp. CS-785/01]MDB9311743.1 sugar transferase [Spirulina sp. CS-785/01]
MTAESPLSSVRFRTDFRTKPNPTLVPRHRSSYALVRKLNSATFKRLFDIVFSLMVLTLGSPVYLILALLIAIASPGPVFYVQQRIGKNYQPFYCIKFRTMVKDADRILGEMMATSPHLHQEFQKNYKLKQDPRITPVGKFLRLTSLDELPQFWNVLKGDMSVVGPRPLVKAELPFYGRYMAKVLQVKPGITGLWQVSGRNDIPYPRRIKMDVYYANSRTVILDLFIIIKTIGVMLFPRNNGAY